jgi:ectoine hydroxylase-related dioxygenase (phytanoyl-CoA dioxygenase family)
VAVFLRRFDNGYVLHADGLINQLNDQGFCVLRSHLQSSLIDACREAFWPILVEYLKANANNPNRGPHRHFLPMPFDEHCFAPEVFFDPDVLSIMRRVMGDRVVADQWGCDVPLNGSENQQFHADYQRPLFPERPELLLPAYMLNVSFGLVRVTDDNGALEIAPGTHRMPRGKSLHQIASGEIATRKVHLEIGDMLIRHPWALHRGTPNITATPRPLVTIRYVRRWYADESREVNPIPMAVWHSLTKEQQNLMRFPAADR